MKRFAVRAARIVLSALAALLAVYILAAGVLGLAGVGGEATPPSQGDDIEIFIVSNGVHTDFVMPMATRQRDWRVLAPNAAPESFVAIGWGDWEFYLSTPTWGDLKATTVLRAALGLNATVLHVEHTGAPPPPSDRVRSVRLGSAQYARLAAHIDGSFARDASRGYRRIPGVRYNDFDAFYEATGQYSVINTCNEWIRAGLSEAGVRTPVWSPFTWAIFHHLPKNDANPRKG